MAYLLALIIATAISVVVIPLMMRAAPRLGMIDHPDARKVHTRPIPRVGGWGIVLGALLPICVFVPMDDIVLAYVAGAAVLVVFGTWDDIRELGHYTKFVGQILAVSCVVYYGDLYVTSFPLLGQDALSPEAGKAFTLFALVGAINAINHSDGLDGLAGGEALFTLLGLALLLWGANAEVGTLIAVAAIGGVLGFMRYNTHPARVFMGDGGSQFLGFTLGVLVVLLTQRVDTSMSPAAVLLLLGLPVADILAVLVQRIANGQNWFRATKNHIHHRLLQLGVVHRNSVVMIYSVQALLVLSGVALRYEHDALVLLVYAAVCAAIFGLLTAAERWNEKGDLQRWLTGGATPAAAEDGEVRWSLWAKRILAMILPVYLLLNSAWVAAVPQDLGIAALILFVLMFMSQPVRVMSGMSLRMVVYGAAMCVLFLSREYPPEYVGWWHTAQSLYLVTLVPVILMALRRAKDVRFSVTATDYLILFIAFFIWMAARYQSDLLAAALMFINAAILLYACEILIVHMTKRWNLLSLASTATLAVLGLRALL